MSPLSVSQVGFHAQEKQKDPGCQLGSAQLCLVRQPSGLKTLCNPCCSQQQNQSLQNSIHHP